MVALKFNPNPKTVYRLNLSKVRGGRETPNFDVVTEAVIDAEVSRVFGAFLDTGSYSKWKMPHMEEKLRGDKKVLQKGSVLDFKIHRFGTPTFTGRITDIIENQKIKMYFFEGDFLGAGEYTFEPVNGKTKIRLRWTAKSNKFLITLFSPFINVPKLQSGVMQLCFEGLNNYLSKPSSKNQHAKAKKQSPYNQEKRFSTREHKMCEFNVILDGKTLFKDAVYAKTENNNVTVKNILGEAKEFKNCKITEVDVNATRLVLTALKP